MNTTLIKLPHKLKDQKVPDKDVILSTQPTTSQVAKQDQKVPTSIVSLQKNSQNKYVPIFGKKPTPGDLSFYCFYQQLTNLKIWKF